MLLTTVLYHEDADKYAIAAPRLTPSGWALVAHCGLVGHPATSITGLITFHPSRHG